jgi:hypothetical protein
VGEGLAELVQQHALSSEIISTADLERIRADMLEAEARKLQPGYVHAWFAQAFAHLGGRMSDRESGRYEITFVPAEIRHRDRLIGTTVPVLPRYQRVTFDKALIRQEGAPLAELVAPGHPVLEAVLDIVMERHSMLLKEGAALVDPSDTRQQPGVLIFLEHAVTDARTDAGGNRRTVSRRFQFVEMIETGELRPAGYAPYLDARPPTDDEARRIKELLPKMAWLTGDIENRALDYGIDTLASEHLAEVRQNTLERVEKVKAAVQARLTREITYWDHRASDLQLQADAGKTPRMNPDRAASRADELQRRKQTRLAELDKEAQLASQPPVVVGAALVMPAHLLHGDGSTGHRPPVIDTEEVERRAVDAVLRVEAAAGRHAKEMPHFNPGYDIRSTAQDGTITFIEVKGRVSGARTFVVTQNELRFAANIPEAYVLGMVDVSDQGADHDRVRYLMKPYGSDVRLPFDTTSTTLAWTPYWQRATAQDS